MKKYVVTGGAGFIGSALVRGLLAREDGEVHVIDNLLTGSKKNLQEIWSKVELHITDIRKYEEIFPIVRGAEVVFHLAAIPSVPRSIHDPVPSHEVNIDGTFQVLRAAADGSARRVVYAASSSAYGDTEVLPKVETMSPRPKSPYAAQKLMGEYYAGVFSECFGLDTVSLRFFNVYGERQDPSSPYSGVISLFMTALLDQLAPTIFGDGEQSRDFTYVEDVVALIMKAADAHGVAGKVYNAGNGDRFSLNEVWATLQKIERGEIAANYGPSRPGDVRHSQADTAAARRDLGHDPQYTLEQGLRRTLAWYRAVHSTHTTLNRSLKP
jgi:nucleoside-diphosphate-sugar epimerase